MSLRFDSIFAPVRIIGDYRSGRAVKHGPVGTGFFVTIESETVPGKRYAHLVTTDHTIAKHGPDVEAEIANPFIEGHTSGPIPIDGRDWVRSRCLFGMDLAIVPWFWRYPEPPHKLMAISLEDLFLRDRSHLRLGSTVYYIGLLAHHNRIMVRTGNVGALDQSGMEVEGGYQQPHHLLDCRSYRGFSGSPCFVEVTYAGLRPVKAPEAYPTDRGGLGELESFAFFIGMLTNHLDWPPDVDGAASRYGVGLMLRNEEIEKALMTKKLRDMRREADEAKDEDEPRFEGASIGSDPADEFERFEQLTRKLAKVSKLEADEQRSKK
jgi:hypothetical protein